MLARNSVCALVVASTSDSLRAVPNLLLPIAIPMLTAATTAMTTDSAAISRCCTSACRSVPIGRASAAAPATRVVPTEARMIIAGASLGIGTLRGGGGDDDRHPADRGAALAPNADGKAEAETAAQSDLGAHRHRAQHGRAVAGQGDAFGVLAHAGFAVDLKEVARHLWLLDVHRPGAPAP